MLRRLQWCHLVCIGLTPLLYALFRLSSEDHDADRQLVENLITLGGAVGGAFVLVFTVVTGQKDEAMPSLLRTYRSLLAQPVFLWVTDGILLSMVILLGVHLAFYRQVEFVSPRTGELLVNDSAANLWSVGVLEKEHPARFRLQIGRHSILLRELGTDKSLDAKLIVVPTIATHPSRVRVLLGVQMEHDYGQAK
jgi:hypothetical protein